MPAGFRLHHTGLVVADIDTARETYVRRFGYEVKSSIIHDPIQAAHVQFLKLPGDAGYLEFVCPDGPHSKLNNALAKGGPLHHLCYATPDIQGACRKLRSEGLSLIQAPVQAAAFPGRRIAWLMGRDRLLVELVEEGAEGEI
jgi:methylmalonyl-CoA/ethylmalonyl-CoA epimerase